MGICVAYICIHVIQTLKDDYLLGNYTTATYFYIAVRVQPYLVVLVSSAVLHVNPFSGKMLQPGIEHNR